MNTQSNAVPEALDSQRVAPAAIAATRPMYWSVRRELWESRAIYIGPLAVAAAFLLGFLVSMIHLPARMRAVLALDPAKQRAAIEMPYEFAAGLIIATTFIVGIFYCLEALHSERRDRSILFWKSLPVSDLTTVLSKASIPLVILPLLTIVIMLVTQLIMLLLNTAVLRASGLSVAMLWTPSLFQMSLMLVYHVLAVHALWYAPIFGWLMLVSGWARRAALLWAILPPLAICVVEKIAFNTSHFANLLMYRFAGPEAFDMGSASMDPMATLAPVKFLSTPGLWTGLIVATAFLAAAVRIRRYRGPI